MEQQKVYIETSVISYLTAKPSRDIVVAGQQELTRYWWEDPIVEEVRQARDEHAASFNYDIDEIFKDLQAKQKKYIDKIVSYRNGKYINIEELKLLIKC